MKIYKIHFLIFNLYHYYVDALPATHYQHDRKILDEKDINNNISWMDIELKGRNKSDNNRNFSKSKNKYIYENKKNGKDEKYMNNMILFNSNSNERNDNIAINNNKDYNNIKFIDNIMKPLQFTSNDPKKTLPFETFFNSRNFNSKRSLKYKCYDQFGSEVTLSGDGKILAIGASQFGDNTSQKGQVTIFQQDEKKSNQWKVLGNRIIGKAGDSIGDRMSLSFDGKILAVGSSFHKGVYFFSGVVRIYQYSDDSDSWVPLGNEIEGKEFREWVGKSVSLSGDGNMLAVGEESGVKVYQLLGNTWMQVGNHIIAKETDVVSLSTDGKMLVLGVGYPGYVKTFEYSNTSKSWELLGKKIVGEEEGDTFGKTLSLASDVKVLAIGTGYNLKQGYVKIYQMSKSKEWKQIGKTIVEDSNEGNKFGYSISLSSDGTVVAIGAPRMSGYVKVFQYSEFSNDWKQLVGYKNMKFVGAYNHNYGGSVHVSSTTTNNNGKMIKLAIGADKFGEAKGYVEIYQYYSDNKKIGRKWEQIGKLVGDVTDGKGCIVKGVPTKPKKCKKIKDKKKKKKCKKNEGNKPSL